MWESSVGREGEGEGSEGTAEKEWSRQECCFWEMERDTVVLMAMRGQYKIDEEVDEEVDEEFRVVYWFGGSKKRNHRVFGSNSWW